MVSVREKLAKWAPALALYLFWPAVLVVAWGELTPNPPPFEAMFWDKGLHFTGYFGLAGLSTMALKARRPAVWAVLGLAFLGGVLEIVQGYVGRDPSLGDEFANILGALSGGGTAWLLLALLERKPVVPPKPSR